jgi:hypothetical protein
MIREFLAGTPLLGLPILAMVLFLLLFLAVLLRVASRGRSATYRRLARLPLDDEPGPAGGIRHTMGDARGSEP